MKIVLDPGHGGPSNPPKLEGSSWNNATGPNGMLEKNVTLAVAKAAQTALAGLPLEVVLTRSTDVNLGILKRAHVARDIAADVFVSLHFNAPDPAGPPAQGTETWINPNSTENSRRLGEAMQRAVCQATGYRDRGVKNDVLVSGVLRNDAHAPNTAHCLVEISFLSRQPEEEARLGTTAYITKLGAAVRDGIVDYCVSAGLLPPQLVAQFAGAGLDEPEDAASAAALHLIASEDAGGARVAAAIQTAAMARPMPGAVNRSTLAAARPIIACDVVIQAGHENTRDGKTGGEGPLGKEIDWTPVVANEAVRLLKEAGVNAIKETAEIKISKQRYTCKLALFIHFDDPDSGESGPSVGFRHDSDAAAAQEWKALYKEYFPFNETWLRDNATPDERYYYGFAYTATSDAEFVIELGDLGSRRQAEWMKPRLAWLGQLIAYYVSRRIGAGNISKPVPFVPPLHAPAFAEPAIAAYLAGGPQAALAVAPIGAPEPFDTPASASHGQEGSSRTKGLHGTLQRYDDGSIVIEATENMTAQRDDGPVRNRTASWRQIRRGVVWTIEQSNYSYSGRELPPGVFELGAQGLPAAAPAGFTALHTHNGIASQFGKFDHQDEGTGSATMGTVQTNSDVAGASIKISHMKQIFGANWRNNSKRLSALVEVYYAPTGRLARVPLVDVGPGEAIPAELDLTWSVDQFLGTHGQAPVIYRILVPA